MMTKFSLLDLDASYPFKTKMCIQVQNSCAFSHQVAFSLLPHFNILRTIIAFIENRVSNCVRTE